MTQMTSEMFHTTFDSMVSDEQRIQFLMTAYESDYPFHLEAYPEMLIKQFYTGTSFAMDVARAFIQCFPAPILCRAQTHYARKPITLMDAFEHDLNEAQSHNELERIIDLLEAFSHLGVKNAEWCDHRQLYDLYIVDPSYNNSSLEQGWSFELLFDSDSDSESDYDSDDYQPEAEPGVELSYDTDSDDEHQARVYPFIS